MKNSYARFYALLKGRPEIDKDTIVSQFTDGRTTHLHEMSHVEYAEMCDHIEYGGASERAAADARLRQARSSALLRIARLGINTVDNWAGVDAFCLSPKIAGKKFAALTVDELQLLVRKLENVQRKGGLAQKEEKTSQSCSLEAFIQMTKTNQLKS